MPLNKAFKLNEYEHPFLFILLLSFHHHLLCAVMRTMWEVLLLFALFFFKRVRKSQQANHSDNMSQSFVHLFSSFRTHSQIHTGTHIYYGDILLWAKAFMLFLTHANGPNYNHEHVMYLVFPQSSRRSGTTAIIMKNFFASFPLLEKDIKRHPWFSMVNILKYPLGEKHRFKFKYGNICAFGWSKLSS